MPHDFPSLATEVAIPHGFYPSKYNPIEHRLFPHISRLCQGVILENIQLFQELISATTTQTGLKVLTTILDKPYQIGRKIADDFKLNMAIVFDFVLPHWNYTAIPAL